MRKRIVAICVCLALCVAAALIYALVLLPRQNAANQPAETTATSLVAGEVAGANGRVQMFDYISSDNLESLYVHNEHGDYQIVRDENNSLVVKGYEYAYLDQEKLIQMIVNAGYTLSTYNAKVNEEDFVKYGLDMDTCNAYFVLRTTTGKRYTVYIGDKTLAGTGYYTRYEGRDAVYVLDDGIEKDLLGPVEYLVKPLLAYPSGLNSYYLMQSFILARGEEVFLAAEYLDPDRRSELAAMSVHRLTEPAEYTASEYYDDVLSLFCDFSGSSCVSIAITDETLEKYGLKTPAYTLYAVNTAVDNNGNPVQLIENYLKFSEKQQDEDGAYFYYAASYTFGIIARVEQIKLDFLEWKLEKWVSPNIFQINIINVDTLAFDGAGMDVTFKLAGKENADLSVSELETGHKPEMKNFRQLWKVLLSVTQEGTYEATEAEKAALVGDESNLLFTMTVKTRAGAERVYRFYPYTDRRVYYTVNGEGEFYVNRTMLNKVIADVGRIQSDEPVDAEGRY